MASAHEEMGTLKGRAPYNGLWADLGGEMRIQRVLIGLAVAAKGCDYIRYILARTCLFHLRGRYVHTLHACDIDAGILIDTILQ